MAIERYDRTTIRLHWATAGLVAYQWIVGRLTEFLPKGPFRLDLWSIHVLLGFALAAVLLARVGWRLSRGRHLPAEAQGAQHVAAVGTHAVLYVLLVGVVGLGVLNVFAHGFPLFGAWHFPKVGGPHYSKVVTGWHNLFANLVAALAFFHAAAALFHHYVQRDGILARMLPGVRPRRAAAPASISRLN
jgi:cytochrome b561